MVTTCTFPVCTSFTVARATCPKGRTIFGRNFVLSGQRIEFFTSTCTLKPFFHSFRFRSQTLASYQTMFALVKIIVVLLLGMPSVKAMYEEDRLREYAARGYEWPLPEVVPNTPGWRTIFERRFEQIEQTIEHTGERYDAWMQAMASALVQPNFTENG